MVILKTDKSKFSLQQLPANEFPLFDNNESDQSFSIAQSDLSAVFNKTQFAMAQQDVRFYWNGLLLEIKPEKLNVVGTDGHRLAKTNIEIDKKNINEQAVLFLSSSRTNKIFVRQKDCKISLVDNQASFAF